MITSLRPGAQPDCHEVCVLSCSLLARSGCSRQSERGHSIPPGIANIWESYRHICLGLLLIPRWQGEVAAQCQGQLDLLVLPQAQACL